jgi:hypothetical protein
MHRRYYVKACHKKTNKINIGKKGIFLGLISPYLGHM